MATKSKTKTITITETETANGTRTTIRTSSSNRRKRKKNTFSWKRALGITQLKRWFTKETGIPLTKAGWERKIGKFFIDLFTGGKEEKKKGKKQSLSANTSEE